MGFGPKGQLGHSEPEKSEEGFCSDVIAVGAFLTRGGSRTARAVRVVGGEMES